MLMNALDTNAYDSVFSEYYSLFSAQCSPFYAQGENHIRSTLNKSVMKSKRGVNIENHMSHNSKS